jgi:hypothetical protein
MHAPDDQLLPETAGYTSRACLAGSESETKEAACGSTAEAKDHPPTVPQENAGTKELSEELIGQDNFLSAQLIPHACCFRTEVLP